MKVSRREQVLLLVCVLVVAVIGVPALLGGNTAVVVKGNGLSKQSIDQRRAEAERTIRRAKETIATQQPIVSKMGWTEDPDSLTPILVQKLEALARRTGLTLTNYKHLKPKALDAVTQVPLEMQFTAPFPTAVRFLYELQKPETKVSIDMVRISSADTESDTVDVDVRISAYSLKVTEPARTTPSTRTRMVARSEEQP